MNTKLTVVAKSSDFYSVSTKDISIYIASKEDTMSEVYEKVPTAMQRVEREKTVLDFWRREHIFEKSIEDRRGHPTYTFYDGPPTANGKPHIGHVLTRVIKDMIPRYRTMKG